MDESELLVRFPRLQQLKKLPRLGTIAGFGTDLLGARDYDEETNTCIKVRCLCLLGLPVLALAAYRVVDRPQGYLFLGREPLPGQGKAFNWVVLILMLGLAAGVTWQVYTTSPEYLAGRSMMEAESLTEAGNLGRAAALYRDVGLSNTSHAAPARRQLGTLLVQPLQEAGPAEAAEVLRIASALAPTFGEIPDRKELLDRGVKLATRHAPAKPREALLILDAVLPLAPDANQLTLVRKQLFERLVAEEPTDVNAASELAVLYEAEGNLARCEPLLVPHAARLGDREGARILGHLFTTQGKWDQAYLVLQPYTEVRLARLQTAEQALKGSISFAEQALIEEIKGGRAPGFPYARFQQAGESERQKIWTNFANDRLRFNPAIKSAQEGLIRETAVVPVVLDLGLVCLQRAQVQADPSARRKDLEQAEKYLLAVQNLAGQSDEFRINLAQVYYWLGKHQEGRRLFDEVLAHRKGQSKVAIQIAMLLREVGEHAAAKSLLEKVYQKELDQRLKYDAAAQRALLTPDLDDRTTWLNRADPADVNIQAMLSESRGRQAIRKGQEEEAIGYFRQAVANYDRQVEISSSLNNSAGVYLRLYSLTGDRGDLDLSLARFEKALALAPSNAFCLHNTTWALLSNGLWEILSERIDLASLRQPGSLSLLGYLYQDEASRQRCQERVRTNPKVARARPGLERLLVVAPKNADGYSTLADLAEFLDDQKTLGRILETLKTVELDVADEKRYVLESLGGVKDHEQQKELRTNITKYEAHLQKARTRGGSTFALAANLLMGLWLQGEALGLSVDADALVRLGEEAYRVGPSRASLRPLMEALCFRINRALADRDPPFARMAARARRSSGPGIILGAALAEHPDRCRKIKDNRDFQRLVKLSLEYDSKFPKNSSPWTWVILRAAGRDEATSLARRLLADQVGQLDRAIRLQVSPFSVTPALESYWYQQIAGPKTGNRAILQRLADQGVPLPMEIK